MNLSKRYLLGMFSGAGSVILKMLLNILVIPLLIGKMGLDIFGLYILLINVIEIAYFLDLGATNALVKLLDVQGCGEKKQAFLWLGQLLFGGVSLVFLIVGLIIALWCPQVFHILPSLTHLAQVCFAVTVIEAALVNYTSYYQAVLLSHCEHQWNNLGDSFYAIFTTLGSLILLLLGADLFSIVLLRLFGTVLRLGLLMAQSYRLEHTIFRLKQVWNDVTQSCFHEMTKLCGHSLTINLSIVVSHKLDAFVIAFFCPLSAVGIYDLVFRMLGISQQVCLKMNQGAFPLFTQMATRQAVAEARQLFLRMSSFLYLTVSLMVLAIVCYYSELFGLFSGGNIPIGQTLPLLFIAIPCILSGVLQMPAGSWLFSSGEQRFLTKTSLLAAVSNLLLSLLLVQWFGIVGVAVGTLLPQLIQHQAGLIRRTCQKLEISLGSYLKNVHVSVLLPLLVATAWIQVWRAMLPMSAQWNNLFPIACISLSACLLSAAIWFKWSASELEIKWAQQFYSSRVLPLLERSPLKLAMSKQVQP